MSKAKPWPTVANRHRTESIMLAGEIIKRTETIDQLTAQLHQAVEAHNIALALAIVSAIEGHSIAAQEKANKIQALLESAPASEEDIPDIARALAKLRKEG